MKSNSLNTLIAFLIASTTVISTLSHSLDMRNVKGNSGFIAKQGGKIVQTKGNYSERRFPLSTFKVPLALMGFDAEILTSKDSPQWEWKEEYAKNFQSWYNHELGLKFHWLQPHTPESFIKHSVIWFSHQITLRLGDQRFQDYIKLLQYGNEDVSGTVGKNDGLLNSWLGTSLKISPLEQVEFLEKLLTNQLPVSKKAQELTKVIMNRHENWNGWQLFGKTGGGEGTIGWFIGWLHKDNEEPIIFVQYLDKSDQNLPLEHLPPLTSAGLSALALSRRMLAKHFPELQQQ